MVSSDFITWVKFLMNFFYDFFYTVNVPGLNIPFIYFFILIGIVMIVIKVIRNIFMNPANSIMNSKKGNND